MKNISRETTEEHSVSKWTNNVSFEFSSFFGKKEIHSERQLVCNAVNLRLFVISIHCAKVTLEEMLEFQIGNDKNGRNILMVILQKKFFLRKRKSEREKETWLKLQLYCKSFLAQKNVCCCSVRWSKNLSDWWKRFGIPNSSFGIAWFFFSFSFGSFCRHNRAA